MTNRFDQADAALALRIFAHFKWQLKIADHSYEEISALLDDCIARCDGIVNRATHDDTVQKFLEMKARFSEMRTRPSEFNVNPNDQ